MLPVNATKPTAQKSPMPVINELHCSPRDPLSPATESDAWGCRSDVILNQPSLTARICNAQGVVPQLNE